MLNKNNIQKSLKNLWLDFRSTNLENADKWIPLICFGLLVSGLVIIYSISPALSLTSNVGGSYFVSRYIIAIILSIFVFYIVSHIPLRTWRNSVRILVVVAVLATLVALVLPVNPNYPAHRWVRLGSLSFESVELVLFAFLIWLSDFLARRIDNKLIKSFKQTLLPVLMVLLILGVVIAGAQSDLGSTAIVVAILFAMLFVAGFPMRRIILIGAVVVVGTIIAVIIYPYRLARIETFFHPDTNCLTTGYQSCQAIISVGSGGLTGVGLGSSVAAYGYLPEADNDSIFAVFAEKFGFIGSVLMVTVYGVLFYRLYLVAIKVKDNFSKLIVIGVLIWISVEMVINVGAMIGLLPLKGITLPFVSYGGTSVIFFAAAIGLVYQISSNLTTNSGRIETVIKRNHKSYENSVNRSRLGRTYNTQSGGRQKT